jgi:hypothetical protein
MEIKGCDMLSKWFCATANPLECRGCREENKKQTKKSNGPEDKMKIFKIFSRRVNV